MELSLELARSGEPTCSLDGRLLHSGRDPGIEAGRFLDQALRGRRPACAILGGPCLDYLTPLLRKRVPGIHVVAIHYAAGFRHLVHSAADRTWYPDDGLPLEGFLDAAVDEDALAGVLFIEWPAGARAFPAMATRCSQAVGASLDRLSSSGATVRASGRTWIRNACRSFLLVERIISVEAGDTPCLVIAAGPSLDETLDGMVPMADRFFSLAASSALAACLARGLVPDLVVATDGGFWSRIHLFPLRAVNVPLALPLSSLPSACLSRNLSFLILDQGQFPEREMAAFLGHRLSMPSRGTVASSALGIAAALSSGSILVAGLDLAVRGIRSHARPHGFDQVNAQGEGRKNPREGLTWFREHESATIPLPEFPWCSSRSLRAYAGAMVNEAARVNRPLRRLCPSPVELPGFSPLAAGELESWLAPGGRTGKPRIFTGTLPPEEARTEFLRERIDSWREEARCAIALLSRGTVSVTRSGATELLRSIDLPGWAELRRSSLRGIDPSAPSERLEASIMAFLDDLEGRFFP